MADRNWPWIVPILICHNFVGLVPKLYSVVVAHVPKPFPIANQVCTAFFVCTIVADLRAILNTPHAFGNIVIGFLACLSPSKWHLPLQQQAEHQSDPDPDCLHDWPLFQINLAKKTLKTFWMKFLSNKYIFYSGSFIGASSSMQWNPITYFHSKNGHQAHWLAWKGKLGAIFSIIF